MPTETNDILKGPARTTDFSRDMEDRNWIRAFDERAWVHAFTNAAKDDSLLAAFRRAFQHRRTFSWLPESDPNDRDALTGAILGAASIPRRSPSLGLVPEAPREELDAFRAIFNSAVELFVEIRTPSLLNKHLELCGFSEPKEFAERALSAYVAQRDSGTASADPW